MTSAANQDASPEVGKTCRVGGMSINYHDQGGGAPLLLIHGSGPGVSAWANWRGVIPELSRNYRVVALDMAGFGYTEAHEDHVFGVDSWLAQVLALLDALGLDRISVVGNSFGGAIALHLACRHPNRIDRVVLMGPVGLSFPLTAGLDAVWGYTPSREAMRHLMSVFAWNQSLINDELVESRYQVSLQRGMDQVYESLFPAPRQRWIEMLAQSEAELSGIEHPTLILHGRDDKVIPLDASIRLLRVLPNADLFVFGHCGHWTQIEKREAFIRAVRDFVPTAGRATAEDDRAA